MVLPCYKRLTTDKENVKLKRGCTENLIHPLTEGENRELSFILRTRTRTKLADKIVYVYASNNIFLRKSHHFCQIKGTFGIGGDFNCILNPNMDWLPKEKRPQSCRRNTALGKMDELGLVDRMSPVFFT